MNSTICKLHSAVEFDLVRLEFSSRTILRDATFSIEPGEFVGVLGPNGAGKTTLIRAILGLVPASSGTLKVLGKHVTRGNPDIGYMPQIRNTPAVHHRVRGYDFITVAANGHRWGLPFPNRETRLDVDRVLNLVDATKLAHRPLFELSGGESQRLLLAQCLLGEPSLLLLDEPLISLDPNHQHSIIDLLQRLQRELSITILFSAHELNPLLNVLDRVLYLGNSTAVLGTIDEVITNKILSKLYGTPIDVMRINGKIFVMSGNVEIEKHDHIHEDNYDRNISKY
ncbi:MAG: ATP-binding cassette domain-containing protein [Burkholderia sp.]|nr:ATP-binding cassette domain-containing protein [Burkholderia sp.]